MAKNNHFQVWAGDYFWPYRLGRPQLERSSSHVQRDKVCPGMALFLATLVECVMCLSAPLPISFWAQLKEKLPDFFNHCCDT